MNKIILSIFLSSFVYAVQAQQSDNELNRDAVTGWRYINNPLKAETYKPIKDEVTGNSNYSVWQQQTEDMLFDWMKRSVLPKGLVVTDRLKDNKQWWLYSAPAIHSYGTQLLGFEAHFVNGKIDLRCCEKGMLVGMGVNYFPGQYLSKGFNPNGLYFFAEKATFCTGDNETKLIKEGVDKQVLPVLHPYRTYLSHYHDNGKEFNTIGIAITKNGDWPFKPVLVKEAVDYINRQLAAYPSILQKNPYVDVKKSLERLKPYYDEVVKLKSINMISDDNGHAIIDPAQFRNGYNIDPTFPEYAVLVAATQQTIDKTRSDTPLWIYLDCPTIEGNPATYDANFATGRNHLINELLRNFNFDYAGKWLSDPQKIKGQSYAPLHEPAAGYNTITTAQNNSDNSIAKNKDANTILFEDFQGYATGLLSVKGWHTFGFNGNQFKNAALETITGQPGKWVSIPDGYTFYPDFRTLPAKFSVDYDIYFSSSVPNKRSLIYFRLDTYDNDPKKNGTIDMKDMNRNGFQFSLALSGEAESNERFMKANVDERSQQYTVKNIKPNEAAHVSILVNGTAVSVSVNGKEVMHHDNVLPPGVSFKRYGWYCGVPGIYLSNIEVKK